MCSQRTIVCFASGCFQSIFWLFLFIKVRCVYAVGMLFVMPSQTKVLFFEKNLLRWDCSHSLGSVLLLLLSLEAKYWCTKYIYIYFCSTEYRKLCNYKVFFSLDCDKCLTDAKYIEKKRQKKKIEKRIWFHPDASFWNLKCILLFISFSKSLQFHSVPVELLIHFAVSYRSQF